MNRYLQITALFPVVALTACNSNLNTKKQSESDLLAQETMQLARQVEQNKHDRYIETLKAQNQDAERELDLEMVISAWPHMSQQERDEQAGAMLSAIDANSQFKIRDLIAKVHVKGGDQSLSAEDVMDTHINRLLERAQEPANLSSETAVERQVRGLAVRSLDLIVEGKYFQTEDLSQMAKTSLSQARSSINTSVSKYFGSQSGASQASVKERPIEWKENADGSFSATVVVPAELTAVPN